jgi:hypothetical protein
MISNGLFACCLSRLLLLSAALAGAARLAAFTGTLGGLEGVDLLCAFLNISVDVRRNGTFARNPPAGRIGINFTVLAGWKLHDFVTADASFYNGTTTAVRVRAAGFCHECTFDTHFNGLTQHKSTSYLLRE